MTSAIHNTGSVEKGCFNIKENSRLMLNVTSRSHMSAARLYGSVISKCQYRLNILFKKLNSSFRRNHTYLATMLPRSSNHRVTVPRT